MGVFVVGWINGNRLARRAKVLLEERHVSHAADKLNLTQSAETYKPLPVATLRHKYWLIWHAKYDNDPSHVWIRTLVLQAMSKTAYSIGYDLKS